MAWDANELDDETGLPTFRAMCLAGENGLSLDDLDDDDLEDDDPDDR